MLSARLAAGMNRYRAWIDAEPIHVLRASQLLSILVVALFAGLFAMWMYPWLIPVVVLGALVAAWMGVAQMTNWRYR